MVSLEICTYLYYTHIYVFTQTFPLYLELEYTFLCALMTNSSVFIATIIAGSQLQYISP